VFGSKELIWICETQSEEFGTLHNEEHPDLCRLSRRMRKAEFVTVMERKK
jgi:hypothetical protein